MFNRRNAMLSMLQLWAVISTISALALLLIVQSERNQQDAYVIVCCEEKLTTHDRVTKMRYVIRKKCSNGRDDTVSVTPSPYFNQECL